MWNLKNKTNKQMKQNIIRLIDTKNKVVVTRGEGRGGLGEIGEGVVIAAG